MNMSSTILLLLCGIFTITNCTYVRSPMNRSKAWQLRKYYFIRRFVMTLSPIQRNMYYSTPLPRIPHQLPPIRIHHNRPPPCNHEKKILRSRQSDIHPLHIAEKADAAGSSRSHAGVNYDDCFPPLECIDGTYFYSGCIRHAIGIFE